MWERGIRMNWDNLLTRMKTIISKGTVTIEQLTIEQWNQLAKSEVVKGIVQDHETLYAFLSRKDQVVEVLEIKEALNSRELQLVQLAVELYKSPLSEDSVQEKTGSIESRITSWLSEQLRHQLLDAEMPADFQSVRELCEQRIPILMRGDFSNAPDDNEALLALLEDFFNGAVLLLSVSDRERLILAEESLLMDSGDEGDEPIEEALASILFGLHEMMASEWLIETHISISHPMNPSQALVSTVALLRETIQIGRQFHVGNHMHLPWKLHLERLLYGLPEAERSQFMNEVFAAADQVLDAETLATLEAFFAQDCNVSETAKTLYIHRNTLLYRLDKFKQETGLDVRHFHHAVLVHLMVLLYKVTKRR